MRAALVIESGVVELRERESPILRPGFVLVAPLFVGLCGSDVSYYRKGANGAFAIREPLTLGHEITAVVREVADDVVGISVGDRVVVHPLWPSPLPGQTHVPDRLAGEAPHFLGSASTWPHTHGGLAELLLVRPERLRIIPPTLPTRRAALAEPLSVVLHALDRKHHGFQGLRVLVCGAGPIGLLAALAVARRGARSVGITDMHERPLAIARELGANSTYRVGASEIDDAEFDVAIEATGVPASLDAALAALAPGGTLIQLGMLAGGGVTADLALVVTKELSLLGSHRFLGELDAALDFLDANPVADLIVTDVLPLDRIAEALDRASDPVRSSKVLVEVSS